MGTRPNGGAEGGGLGEDPSKMDGFDWANGLKLESFGEIFFFGWGGVGGCN